MHKFTSLYFTNVINDCGLDVFLLHASYGQIMSHLLPVLEQEKRFAVTLLLSLKDYGQLLDFGVQIWHILLNFYHLDILLIFHGLTFASICSFIG